MKKSPTEHDLQQRITELEAQLKRQSQLTQLFEKRYNAANTEVLNQDMTIIQANEEIFRLSALVETLLPPAPPAEEETN